MKPLTFEEVHHLKLEYIEEADFKEEIGGINAAALTIMNENCGEEDNERRYEEMKEEIKIEEEELDTSGAGFEVPELARESRSCPNYVNKSTNVGGTELPNHLESKNNKEADRDKTTLDYSRSKENFSSIHKTLNSFKCAECGYSCFQKRSLAIHISGVHKKLKPFKCDECGYSCSRESSLAIHISGVHKKLKPFKCDECDYSCFRKYELSKHVSAVHRKLKPFKCDECDYSCFRKYELSMHVSAVHRKLKPFKCIHCDHSFSRKTRLSNHIFAIHEKL